MRKSDGKTREFPTVFSGKFTRRIQGILLDKKHLDLVKDLGQRRVDITVGSALDIFGGQIPYQSVVEWHRSNQTDAQDDY